MSLKDIPNFEELTDLERLGLAEELAASIRNPEALPAPVAHRLELEKRWARYEQDPAGVISLEQFWKDVHAQGMSRDLTLSPGCFTRASNPKGFRRR